MTIKLYILILTTSYSSWVNCLIFNYTDYTDIFLSKERNSVTTKLEGKKHMLTSYLPILFPSILETELGSLYEYDTKKNQITRISHTGETYINRLPDIIKYLEPKQKGCCPINKRLNYDVHEEPAIGLLPLEIWIDPQNHKSITHFGHKITSITKD